MKTKTALLIVDAQVDFCPGGALAAPDGNAIITPLNCLITHAWLNGWLVVASRCWHKKKTKHFKEFGGEWPEHCVARTPGAQFHPMLEVDPNQHIIISKGLGDADDYSAFDGQTDRGTYLAPFLKINGIKTIVHGGLVLKHCVSKTALDAKRVGFEVIVINDASGALSEEDRFEALTELAAANIRIATTEEIING